VAIALVRKPHRPSGGGGGDDGGGEVGGGGAGGGDGGEGQLLAAARSASVLTEVLATCTCAEDKWNMNHKGSSQAMTR